MERKALEEKTMTRRRTKKNFREDKMNEAVYTTSTSLALLIGSDLNWRNVFTGQDLSDWLILIADRRWSAGTHVPHDFCAFVCWQPTHEDSVGHGYATLAL